ncbi:methyltransferase domain-containing protein [Novosphingobium sp. FSY-8]|uniref:Methyltransferase domain-containing protein n=1 Tax=Novosphingobium ovatum TaxID=1908523 RepID=A0ABW9X8T7_9SPHN|nr:class I SAM-dependent methyltransferase [Novosphingobium ovatum]NBC34937.1 methyltransferase domain-containing protein [Novosphingobium ovatum]
MGGTIIGNIDPETVAGFGAEWAAFDQTALEEAEWRRLFERYFRIFPWNTLPKGASGFDLGCGSGRWAAGVAPRVGHLHCIDPASDALAVARRRMAGQGNVSLHHAGVDAIPLGDGSQDFGYSLGVLHHIPDTAAALRDCVAKLKPGAPFLVYLYYAFDNRPAWFRALWRASDVARRGICRLPFWLRRRVTSLIAALAYWPLARAAGLAEMLGVDVARWPLSSYRQTSFYTMRTDALDRLGTRLEQRFTRAQMADMMAAAGLENIRFSDEVPYWVAVGTRRQTQG